MQNAGKELLSKINPTDIKCAVIAVGDYTWSEDATTYIIKENYSGEELKTFFKSLDFMYDAGYGGQQLFGTVWLKDGIWLTRGEYDGSEWWDHHSLPEVPDLLK